MERHSRISTIMVAILVMCVAGAGYEAVLAEIPYGTPKANMEVSDLVPVDLVEKIALKKAQQKWGPVAPGPVLPACDDDGDIVAYIFTFAIGAKAFPVYSDILNSVKEGREIALKGFDAMTETDRQKVLDDVAIGMEGQTNGARSGGPQPGLQARANEKARRLGREKRIGAGPYGTIVVSARYDCYPVPLYMHYLPPQFYQGDLAAEKAAGVLLTDSATLERIYFIERMRTMYSEYSANGQNVLLHSYHLGVEAHEKALTGRGLKRALEPEVKSRLDEEWAKIRREVE
jgi:hypothetical protein